MTNKQFLLFMYFLGLSSATYSVSSQTTIAPEKILRSPAYPVTAPLICDTINAKGEKYESSSMLKISVNLPEKQEQMVVESRDTSGFFRATRPYTGRELIWWKFYLHSSRFSSPEIEIKSPNPFEIYIDGVKFREKTTRENSLKNAGKVSCSIKADPGRYEVSIKMLTYSLDPCEPALQINIKSQEKDSLARLTATTSAKRTLSVIDFLEGKRPGGVTISPNGEYALVAFTTTGKDGTLFKSTELFDLNRGGSIVVDTENSKGLSWMPQSNLLYYAAKGLNGRELRTIDPRTMREQVLANRLPEGSFSWSPKENFLIFSVPVSAPEDNGLLRRTLSPEERVGSFRKRESLYIYQLKSGLFQPLTFGKENANLCDISSDETKILFLIRKDQATERPFSETSVYQLNLQNYKVDTLVFRDKYISEASYSPDGKKLLLLGAADALGGVGLRLTTEKISNIYDNQAYLMDIASKKVDPITKEFNPSVSSCKWNKNDGLIYMKVVDRDYVRVYACNAEKRSFRLMPFAPDVIANFDPAETGSRIIYYGTGNCHSGKVYLYDTKSKKENLIADPSALRLDSVVFGEVSDWNFKQLDGTTIYGRCYYPPHMDKTKKYPVIVYYYGGTTPVDRSFERNYPLNLYASMGYIVYTLQPSGAIGFGQDFSARHVNAWGLRTADEIIEGTKRFCREHPNADSTRIGCLGASYGGFMTMYLQTKTDIFKAAVSHAGISSIASYWGEGYWGYTYSAAASANSYPWNNARLYTEQSPLYHADKIKTPLLLLHGTADTNVPVGESIQMYNALKILGKPVEFIRIEGENHIVTGFQKRLEWQKTILSWFARHLQNDNRWWNELYKPSVLE